MKVLYAIRNPYGLGADRWIYDGYKNAFLAEGHQFYTITELDNFQKKVYEIKPDLFLLDFCFLEKNVPKLSYDTLLNLKKEGTKIFCSTDAGLDKENPQEKRIALFRKYVSLFDLCFSSNAPETMSYFEGMFQKPIYFLPHSADTAIYYPDKPDPRFSDCDIAFVGSFYTQKKTQFEQLLLPLLNKHRVCIYGQGRGLKDKILRVGGGITRRLKLPFLMKAINSARITISPDDERKLNASAAICVNIHEYYNDGASKGQSVEREFKVPASGGFQISDYCIGMERYFELGREIVAVKTPEEWFKAIDYYLKNEKARKEIQERGTARVLKEHTRRHRVKELVEICRRG